MMCSRLEQLGDRGKLTGWRGGGNQGQQTGVKQHEASVKGDGECFSTDKRMLALCLWR